ncbi:MAG: hypothetical protein NZ846_09850 [Thermus sp.]|uniref:hypothetical protein n=1 Tax=Thermus sp. TaxID=275 RepID=UPI0025E7A6FD|nr:hypothetical protein [Thermus sp.]MCS7219254.1 hypothetical protein [Thermus sp.]MDW8018184.1 hypothetical protein [Thermus sp.]
MRRTLLGLLGLLALAACGGGGGNPSFQIALVPENPSLTAARGESRILTLRLTPEGGFRGTVNLTLELQGGSSPPPGLSLSPSSLTVDGSNPITQPLTLSVGEATPTGQHRLQLRAAAANGSLSRTAPFVLSVPVPGLRLNLPPGIFSLTRGQSSSMNLELIPESGFRGEVELSLLAASGSLPTGLSHDPTRVTVTAPTTLSLSLSTTPRTPTGLYPLRLRAAGGGVSAEASLPLFVGAKGEPDTSFDADGVLVFDTVLDTRGANNAAYDLLWLGGVLLAGGYGQKRDGSTDFTLSALTAAGILLGTQATDFGGNEVILELAPQPNGEKFVAVGYSSIGDTYRIALARYDQSGQLDRRFGRDGKMTDTLGSASIPLAAVVDESNRIVVAGYSLRGRSTELFLTRYLENGTLDTSFGTEGRVLVQVGSGSLLVFSLLFLSLDLLLQPDGKLVVAGVKEMDGRAVLFLRRYGANGAPDSSFGSGGEVTFTTGSHTFASALLLQPDGKLVVAGSGRNGTNHDFLLMRYNPNGTLDDGFGSGGHVFIPVGTGDDIAQALVQQPDGRLVVAGHTQTSTGPDFALVRCNPDGSLDTSFGTGGKVTTSPGPGGDDLAFALLLQPDGRLVVAGSRKISGGNLDHALVRYW